MSVLQDKINRIIIAHAPDSITLEQIKLISSKLMDLLQNPHNEPVNYVTRDGVVKLPDHVINRLNLQQGGGISFMPNKATGKLEIWAMDELDAWFCGEAK